MDGEIGQNDYKLERFKKKVYNKMYVILNAVHKMRERFKRCNYF